MLKKSLQVWGHYVSLKYFNATQNLIAEHYERDFDMIFHFKLAQNLDAEHYVRNFDMIFYFLAAKNWLQSTM